MTDRWENEGGAYKSHYGAMYEPRLVRVWLFTHYPYTPYAWTLEQINEARKAVGVEPYE